MKTAAFSAAELRFWGWIPRAPDLSDFYAKGRGGLQPGASRDCRPPWGPPESRPRRWEFRTAKRESRPRCPDFSAAKRESRLRCPDFFTAKCESRPRRPDFFTAKCESRPRRPDFFTAKRESRLRCPDFFTAKCESRQRRSPLPGRGFFGREAGRNGALPYNARKSQFLRNGDVRATESLFLFAVLWLAFLPGQSETGVAGGGKARRPETPGRPAAARPTTATGSRFLRRQRERLPRRPRPSPPAREGSLGAPNDRTFPPGAERKAERKKERRNPG
jgi:hypothetical protein